MSVVMTPISTRVQFTYPQETGLSRLTFNEVRNDAEANMISPLMMALNILQVDEPVDAFVISEIEMEEGA